MYVDAGLGVSNPIMISIITSGASFPRIWKIKVTQITCGSISSAPQGCLQYHTGINGRVKSFNYNVISGRQLSNQDYSICMRTEKNFCSIQYSACTDLENNRSRAFTISGNSNNVVGTMVGVGGQGSSSTNACGNDWLLFGCVKVASRPQSSSVACEDRICGGTFNAEVGLNPMPVSSKSFNIFFLHSIDANYPSNQQRIFDLSGYIFMQIVQKHQLMSIIEDSVWIMCSNRVQMVYSIKILSNFFIILSLT